MRCLAWGHISSGLKALHRPWAELAVSEADLWSEGEQPFFLESCQEVESDVAFCVMKKRDGVSKQRLK